MRIKIIHVSTETVTKGRSSYNTADVLYDFNGQKKNFKLFSFTNPAVYKVVTEAATGAELDITVGKNDKGYDAWNAAAPATGAAPASAPAANAAKPFVDSRETPAEREARQRYIIRQSSLSNAIAVLTAGAKSPPKQEEVFALAEEFVGFVFDLPEIEKPSLIDMESDIPY